MPSLSQFIADMTMSPRAFVRFMCSETRNLSSNDTMTPWSIAVRKPIVFGA